MEKRMSNEINASALFNVTSVTSIYDQEIEQHIAQKTKPLGALGQLEDVAWQIARIQLSTHEVSTGENSHGEVPFSTLPTPSITQPSLIVFAGDHGVASQGVSIAPSEVTGQMVANFAHGGAAINIFCQQFSWHLSVVDAGTLLAEDHQLPVIKQRLGRITGAINHTKAMSYAQVLQGFNFAKTLVQERYQNNCNLIAFGEMGIGNTTSAAAIMSAIMKLPATETVGKGTGVSDEIVTRKQKVVEQALALHHNELDNSIALLACLGGYEIVQITGAMLAAAELKMTIVVDGFICTAAALVALTIAPNAKDYMIFAHNSGEQGHEKILNYLAVKPLLNLGLRLGEGTGAALALPMIKAAIAFYNEMASFAQADVDNVVI